MADQLSAVIDCIICQAAAHVQDLPLLTAGADVEANYNRGGEWYCGRIDRVNSRTSKADLAYDDGDAENDVEFGRIRVRLQVGNMVEVLHRGRYMRAKVTEDLRSTAKYGLKLDGSGERLEVDRTFIRRPLAVGDSVYVAPRQAGPMVKGRVTRVSQSSGNYDVKYDSGSTEEDVPPSRVSQVLARSVSDLLKESQRTAGSDGVKFSLLLAMFEEHGIWLTEPDMDVLEDSVCDNSKPRKVVFDRLFKALALSLDGGATPAPTQRAAGSDRPAADATPRGPLVVMMDPAISTSLRNAALAGSHSAVQRLFGKDTRRMPQDVPDGDVEDLILRLAPNATKRDVQLLLDCFVDADGNCPARPLWDFISHRPEPDDVRLMVDKIWDAVKAETKSDEATAIKDVFGTAFDVDESKTLSAEEIKAGCGRLNLQITSAEAHSILRFMDLDHTGDVELSEFKALLHPDVPVAPLYSRLRRCERLLLKYTGANVATILAAADRFQKGTLDRDNLRVALLEAGLPFNEVEIRRLADTHATATGLVDLQSLYRAARLDADAAAPAPRKDAAGAAAAPQSPVPERKRRRSDTRPVPESLSYSMVSKVADKLRRAMWDTVDDLRRGPKRLATKEAIEQAFKTLDTSGTGAWDVAAVSRWARKLAPDFTEKELDALVACFDENGDGRVDLGEFKQFLSWEPENGEELGIVLSKVRSALQDQADDGDVGRAALRILRRADTNRNDVLEATELKRALADARIRLSDSEFQSMWRRLDSNSDGRISVSELVELLEPPAALLAAVRTRVMAGFVRHRDPVGAKFASSCTAIESRDTHTVPFSHVHSWFQQMSVLLNEREERALRQRFEPTRAGFLHSKFLEFCVAGDAARSVPVASSSLADDWFTQVTQLLAETPGSTDVRRRMQAHELDRVDDFKQREEAVAAAFRHMAKDDNALMRKLCGWSPDMQLTPQTAAANAARLLSLLVPSREETLAAALNTFGGPNAELRRDMVVQLYQRLVTLGTFKGLRLDTFAWLARMCRLHDAGDQPRFMASKRLTGALMASGAGLTIREAEALVSALPVDVEGVADLECMWSNLSRVAAGLPVISADSVPNELVLVAYEKLLEGPVPDAVRLLETGLGVPIHCMPSVLAKAAVLPAHQLAVCLEPAVESARISRGTAAATTDESKVAFVGTDALGPGAAAGDGLTFRFQDIMPDVATRLNKTTFSGHVLGELRPIAHPGGPPDPTHIGDQVSQAVLVVQEAEGIPLPDADRRADIVSRHLMMSLVQVHSAGNSEPPAYQVCGNVYSINAGWFPAAEDVWKFGTGYPDARPNNIMLMRHRLPFGTPPVTGQTTHQLHVLVEFVTTIVHRPTGHQESLTVCWGSIPWSKVITGGKVAITMFGGTCDAPAPISKTLFRRMGLASCGSAPAAPILRLVCKPATSLSAVERAAIGYLPMTVIAPVYALPVLQLYRQSLATTLTTTQPSAYTDMDTSAVSSAPHLPVFREIVCDESLLWEFVVAWRRVRVRPDTPSNRKAKFQQMVLQMLGAVTTFPVAGSSTVFRYTAAHQTTDPLSMLAPKDADPLLQPFHPSEVTHVVTNQAPVYLNDYFL